MCDGFRALHMTARGRGEREHDVGPLSHGDKIASALCNAFT